MVLEVVTLVMHISYGKSVYIFWKLVYESDFICFKSAAGQRGEVVSDTGLQR